MPLAKKSNKSFLFSSKAKFHPGKFPDKKPKKRQPKKVPKATGPLVQTGTFIPLHRLSLDLFIFFIFHPYINIEKRKHVMEMQDTISKIKIQTQKVDFSYLQKKYKCIILWLNFEQRLRHAFFRLLVLWRQKKYGKRVLNTEDPITLNIPVEPVYIFDIGAKGNFVFEAKTLKKSMESNLFFNDWLFPEPQTPKNILTNLHFTGAQIIKIIYDLRKYGLGSWGIEAFKKCEWNLSKFLDIHHIPLKIEGLKSILRNKSSTEFKTLLKEFVEDHYEMLDESEIVNVDAILWAVDNEPDLLYIQRWTALFEKYYTLDIVCGSVFNALNKHKKNLINSESRQLLLEKDEIKKLNIRKRNVQFKRARESISECSSAGVSVESSSSVSSVTISNSPSEEISAPQQNILIPIVPLFSTIDLGLLMGLSCDENEIIIYGDA